MPNLIKESKMIDTNHILANEQSNGDKQGETRPNVDQLF